MPRRPPSSKPARVIRRVRSIATTVAAVVIGVAIFVFLVVSDTQLVADVYERSRTATTVAVAAAVVGAVATVLAVVWFGRRRERLGRPVRRAFGAFAIAWSVLFVIAFAWTHPRGRDAEDAGPLEAGVVAYVLLIVVAAVAFAPIALIRQARRKHQPGDWVHVVYIPDKEPFCVAYCDCGWVGEAHDGDEPDACKHAFRDAREHGENVAPEVERPYG